jgi:hypothetical protein
VSRFATAALALALLHSAAAWGGEEGGAAGLRFDPRLENTESGGRFTVTGQVGGYPDGTAVHVTLLVEGRSRAPIRALFLKATLEGGKFGAEFAWPGRKLAPMAYKAQVALYVDEQRPDVRRQVIQEYGWPSGHCEVLGATTLQFGTDGELGEFARQSIVDLRKLVVGFEALRTELQPLVAAPGSEEAVTAVIERLAESERKFVRYSNTYVVRVEGELVQRLQSVVATLSRSVRHYLDAEPEENPASELLEAGEELTLVLAEIDSRLPLDLQEQPEKQDEQKKDEDPRDGQ